MRPIRPATLIVLLGLALALDAFAASESTRPATSPKSGVTLSGAVSADAKTFTTDDENEWTVLNAEALKGFEKRYITVQCRIEPEKRAIRVLSVSRPVEHPPNLGDSAYRR